MKKALLLIFAVLFFARCNNVQDEKPAKEHVVKDTFAQAFMAPFNATPKAKTFYLQVKPKEESLPRTQQPAILSLLAGMKSQPQHFTINTSEKNELQGEYGTRLSLEPNCFVAENGNSLSAPVEIEFKECYSKEEMLAENLTTTSNNRLLESKGAVYVSAKCNGEEVKLKEGEQISIQFPFAVNKGYGFFYGNKTGQAINWQALNNADDLNGPIEKTKIARPEFSFKGYSLNDYLISQLEYPEDAKRNELSANVEATFTVDKAGKVRDVSCLSSYKTFRDEIIYTLQQMPKWKAAQYGKRKISAQVKVSIDFNLRRKNQIEVAFNADDVVPLITDHSIVKEQTSIAALYTGTFEKLGWIGCSRYAEVADQKADVVVSCDANCDVKLVYKNKMSIVGGDNFVGYSRFSNLPVDAEVFMVALRCQNGEFYYALQPVKLQKQTVISPIWRKGTRQEIEKMYQGIS